MVHSPFGGLVHVFMVGHDWERRRNAKGAANKDETLLHVYDHGNITYHANNLIYRYVMQCKFMRVNTVIHASPSGGGKIHNETPLSRLTLFWDNPKTAHVKKRERRGGKGASNPPQGHFSRQVLIDYWGVLIGWGFVPFGRLERLWRRKT